MRLSRDEFARLYRVNSLSLTGSDPSENEVEENYRYYLELVDLANRSGDLHFMLDDRREMTWEFSPQSYSPCD